MVVRIALAALLLAPPLAAADPACLPKAVFSRGDSIAPVLDLGLVDGAPTLCAHADWETGGLLGCWRVDARRGKLAASTATSLPGHSRHLKTDAKGCVDGYCTSAKVPANEDMPLFAISTDGKHAVMLREMTLYVFDTATKKQVTIIPLSDEKAPNNTNVGNAPIDIHYTGNRIYVAGTDAGPYIAVWAYRDDGTRLGAVGSTGPDTGGTNVYDGAVNTLDDNRVLLADAGWQHVTIVSAADGKAVEITRAVKTAPCKPEELGLLDESGGASKACRKVIDKLLMPFAGLDPIALPDGTILAAMDGKGRGTLMVLDGTKLTEKKRLKLKRCSK